MGEDVWEESSGRKVAEAAPGSRRMQAGLLLRLRQGRRGLTLYRGRFRVGNSLYLDVVSHVVGELVWILDGPDLVVAVGDQSQLGPLLEMILVIALLVAGCGAHGVRDPTLDRDRLLGAGRHCGDSEEQGTSECYSRELSHDQSSCRADFTK